MNNNDGLEPQTEIRLYTEGVVTFEEYEQILLERRRRREQNPTGYTHVIGSENRPPRGNLYEWAKQKERLKRYSNDNCMSQEPMEQVMERLEQKRKENLKRSYEKAIKSARESRRKGNEK